MHQHYSLKDKNTLAMPALAEHFCCIHSTQCIPNYLNQNQWQEQPKLILGGGSNIFFQNDVNGLVIYPQFFGCCVLEETATDARVVFGASESWDACVAYCVQRGYFGLENLSGIPGTVGAAPVQNIGAYGVEIAQFIDHIDIQNIETGVLSVMNRSDCAFAYRDSIFKHRYQDQQMIYAVCLRLPRVFAPQLSYRGISEHLSQQNMEPTAANIRQAVLAIRRTKLPSPSIVPNAGSFFKNPIIPVKPFEQLQARHPDMPSYPAHEGHIKVPAGWLIEQSGLKGYRHLQVGVYPKHALVLTNDGDGNASQMRELVDIIVDTVNNNFGIRLEPEVRIV